MNRHNNCSRLRALVSTAIVGTILGIASKGGAQPSRVTLTFDRMPPTRTWCVVETVSEKKCPEKPANPAAIGDADEQTVDESSAESFVREHVTFEWDPISPGSLRRDALIPGGCFNVSCSAEPARHAIQPNCDYAWHAETASPKVDSSATGSMSFSADCVSKGNPTNSSTDKAAGVLPTDKPAGGPVLKDQLPPNAKTGGTLTIRVDKQNASSAAVLRAQATAPGIATATRSLGLPTEAALAEVFRAVAEVVMERVSSEGLRVVKERLTVALAKYKEDLPNTHVALARLNLADLEHTARDFRQALQQDALAYALKPSADSTTRLAAFQSAMVGKNFDANATRLLVADVLESAAQGSTDGKPTASAAKSRLIATLLIEAANSGRVSDSGYLRRAAMKPAAYLGLHDCGALGSEDFELLASGASLVTPSASSEEDRLAHALAFAAELRALEVGKRKRPGVRARLIHAALTGELEVAVNLIGTLSDKTDPGKQRVFQSIVLLAAIVDVPRLGPSPTPEELQKSTERRKRAVERLIDSNVPRGSRDGWVASFGSLLHTNVAWPLKPGKNPTRFQPLGIGLGLGLDHHCVNHWGFHADFSPLDLGAYASFKNEAFDVSPDYWSVVAPQVSVGATLVQSESSVVWFLGANVAVRPRPMEPADSGIRDIFVGASFGAYVPLLDFN